MGWHVHDIPQSIWTTLKTDTVKEDYIAKSIAHMYMDAQFIHKPSWMQPYHAEV
ncbi:hypothetical protein BBBOND_0208250 [Babesia bigemina]|uniref:RAP domain-containing protein n=1 Tax=Babesia bigemina TaxID=5866 RepID=A0A061D4N0_BABBI|nr:hypothetical protein BBBOND_0208250 [Babesia bigemina]CDR95671.1 hypothetical protein BBBOND_0208250 [Babesia bigemina]|eukprot:XP_012767857.1 hypothetical protein BBBOND_0208250 [Babesia bigemina]